MDAVDGMQICERAGIDRIELCSALSVGGLTPSYGLMAKAARLSTATCVMIRPTAGNFMASEHTLSLMLDDISAVRNFGLQGIVVGVLDADNNLNMRAMRQIVKVAAGLDIVLHRAIDLSADPLQLIEQAIDLGIKRILTSGGQLKAMDGIGLIRQMVKQADGRIEIMAGSGIKPDNVAEIVEKTGVRDVHASCSISAPQRTDIMRLGFAAALERKTDLATIVAMQQALAHLGDQSKPDR